MLRKNLHSIYTNNGWMESHEERNGLFLPTHRLFSPNLSKSAPCKCCKKTTQSNCTDCTAALPVSPAHLYIDDSVHGTNIVDLNVTGDVTVSVQGYNVTAECTTNPGVYSVSQVVNYALSCHLSGSTYYLIILVTYWACLSGKAMAGNGVSPASKTNTGVGSSHVNLPLDCSLSSGGFITFPMPVEGNFSTGNPKYYPGGGSLKLHS